MKIPRLAQASMAFAVFGGVALYFSASGRSYVAAPSSETIASTGPGQTKEKPAKKPDGLVEIDGALVLPEGMNGMAAQSIETAPIAIGRLSRHLAVPGTIVTDADRVARVPARVVGTVAQMRRRLGDDVKAGETVAVLDSREVADTKSEYLTASVNLDLQKTLYERAKGLWDKRVSAENQYLQVRNTFIETQLRADLARQKLSALGIDAAEVGATMRDAPDRSNLRQYKLRAPISGRIVERKVDVGTAVGKEGDPADVYTIADLSTLWVELSVPTAELGGVREGARVGIVTGGEGAQRGDARIVFISPLLNQDTRSARVIATLPNADLRWRPASYVTAEIAMPSGEPKPLVPRSAIQTIDGDKGVFVRNATGFERRKVVLGGADDDAFEAVSGLEAGEVVAVRNAFLLKAELGKSDADGE